MSARTIGPPSLGGALRIALVAHLAVLYAAVYWIQNAIDARFGKFRAVEEVLYVQDGELFRKLLVGYENITADLYWLRTVQYFGGARRDANNKNYDVLEPLLRITTDLNPDLLIAYTYGATFLSTDFPAGAGKPYKGIELIDLGIERHPERWRFYLDKGFIYFWFLQEYRKAGEIFLEGSKVEGSPYWMTAMAGRAAVSGGERGFAREMWHNVRDSAENEQIRANAELHLSHLDALDEIDSLQSVVDQFRTSAGRAPRGWEELVSLGQLRGVPRDPTGQQYLLADSGRVDFSSASNLAVLPRRKTP